MADIVDKLSHRTI